MNLLLRNSHIKNQNWYNMSLVTNIIKNITTYVPFSSDNTINKKEIYEPSFESFITITGLSKIKKCSMCDYFIPENMNKINATNEFIPVRFENSPIQQKFKQIIDNMRDPINHNIMQQCYYELCKICKIYPPRKNENKMIYGKLAEASIGNALYKMNIDYIDLDKLCNASGEYKTDFKIGEFRVSLKTKKNKKSGNIILINTHSTSYHGDKIKIDVLLCIIEDGKLYFIPHDIVDESIFIKHNPGNIAYMKSIIKYMDDHYSEFIYTFPGLSEKQKNEIANSIELDIMRKLYACL